MTLRSDAPGIEGSLAPVCIEVAAGKDLAGGVVALGAALLPVRPGVRLKDGVGAPGAQALPCVVAPTAGVLVLGDRGADGQAGGQSSGEVAVAAGPAGELLPEYTSGSVPMEAVDPQVDWCRPCEDKPRLLRSPKLSKAAGAGAQAAVGDTVLLAVPPMQSGQVIRLWMAVDLPEGAALGASSASDGLSPAPKAAGAGGSSGRTPSAADVALARGAQVAVWASAEALLAGSAIDTSGADPDADAKAVLRAMQQRVSEVERGVGPGSIACTSRAHALLPVAAAFRVGVSCRGDPVCPPADLHGALGPELAGSLGALLVPAVARAGMPAAGGRGAGDGQDAHAAVLAPGGLVQACVRLSTGASSAVLAVRGLEWTLDGRPEGSGGEASLGLSPALE